MKPPKCKFCGREEWRHVCVVTAPVTPNPVVTDVVTSPFKKWYEKNKETYRRTQRYVMQVRRAIQAGRACAWPRAA